MTVVEVVEAAGQALVPDGRATESERRVATGREAGGVDGTSLCGLVKLELVVVGDVAGAILGVKEHAVLEGQDKGALARALALLSQNVSQRQLKSHSWARTNLNATLGSSEATDGDLELAVIRS